MSDKWRNLDAWDLADIVGKSYALLSHLADQVASVEGVTTTRIIALGILDDFPEGLTQTDWGKYQGVSRQRASIVAGELKTEGLIEIVSAGRSSIISLSSKGKRAVDKYKQTFGGALRNRLGGFSRIQGKQLTALLEELITCLEQKT